MLQDTLLAPRPPWLPAALMALVRHEVLSLRQLAALVAEAEHALVSTLDALVREELLAVYHPITHANEAAIGPVFALTRRGYRAVGESRVHPVRRSTLMIAHDVLRNDVGVVLELLDRQGLLRLLDWQTAKSRLADATWIVERSRAVRVPLVADALAVVDASDGPDTFLIETDRGTVSAKRMALRYRGYQSWWRDGGPARRFGSKRLRVLTLVPDEARLNELRMAALHATEGRGSRLYWFAQQSVVSAVDPKALLSATWRTAQPDDSVSAILLDVSRAKLLAVEADRT
ncbi:MAG: replication-relaxation family protein [Myxococcales bacterium]|nr:replication-relaxation family protein [Myxococcales bacterium]